MASKQPLLVVNPLELDVLLSGVQAFLGQPKRGLQAPMPLRAPLLRFHLLGTPLIRGRLARKGVLGPDLEDLTQETWHILSEKLQHFQPSGPGCVAAWIGRIAARVAARHWRRAKCGSAPAILSTTLDSLAAAEPGPAATAERREQASRLHAVIAEVRSCLSEENRLILDEFLLSNRPAADVARDLGVSRRAVYERARRIRRQVAQALRACGIDEE